MSGSGAEATPLNYVAISGISALGWLTQIALPYEVATLADGFAFGSTIAGLVTALEALAMAVTVVLVGRSIDRRDKRTLCGIGIAIAMLASLVSLAVETLWTMSIVRGVFGIGLGLIAAATNALPSRYRHPERLFASMQFTVGLVFVAIMYFEPVVHAHAGRLGLIWVEISFLALFSPLIVLIPRPTVGGAMSDADLMRGPLPPFALPFLLALGTLFISASATWSFAAQAGQGSGLPAHAIANGFTISALANNIGAVAAAALGLRMGQRLPLCVGFVLLSGATLLMYAGGAAAPYTIGVILFSPAFAFLVPYLQGILAELDGSGRSASLGGAAIMFGGSIGPAIGGLLSVFRNLPLLGICIAAITAAAAATSLIALQRRRGPSSASVAAAITVQ